MGKNKNQKLPDREAFVQGLAEAGVDRDVALAEYNRVFPVDVADVPITREKIELAMKVAKKYPPEALAKLNKRTREAVERLQSGYYLEHLQEV